jgi:hypothetical protein
MFPTVRYELKGLEHLLSKAQGTLARKSRVETRLAYTTETERIKERLVCEACSFADDHHLGRYIRFHQEALTRLMDKTQLLSKDSGIKSHQKDFYHSFLLTLDELLSFIERYFSNYFDWDARAPATRVEKASREIQITTIRLHDELARQQADEQLVGLLLHTPRKIIQGQGRISFHDLRYALAIQNELTARLEANPGQAVNETLREVMLTMNCNDEMCFANFRAYIEEQLTSAESPTGKINTLSFLLKSINQTHARPGMYGSRDLPPLKTRLSNYLLEEVEHAERLIRSEGTSHSLNGHPNFTLKSGASVAQLAYLVRVFMETRILLDDNVTRVLSLVAKSITTRHAGTISYGSIRSKYYDVESGTRASVRNMLQNMIHHIDKS